MSTISQLSALDTVTAGDQLAVFSGSNGDTRKAAMSVILAYMQANNGQSGFTKQPVAPSATGFNITVTDTGADIWLLMRPLATYATGTITLPAAAADGQEVLVNSTQIVTALTVDGNGAVGVEGEPSALTANGFFRMRYDGTTSIWYRVG